MQEGMVDLVPIGPSQILEAYGRLSLKIWTYNDDGSYKDPPLIVGWGVDVEEEVENAYSPSLKDLCPVCLCFYF
jgi:hypothetical protein